MRDMNRSIFPACRVLHLLVILVLCACAADPGPSEATDQLIDLLPDPAQLDGWELAEKPVGYRPGTLWEYLNGGAPLYESYGFQELVHARYQMQDDPDSGVTLDIFDMGSDLGAFGLFSSMRPPGAVTAARGAESYRSDIVGAFWKGRVFVHVEADQEDTALIEAVDWLISEVSRKIPGTTDQPSILAVLPRDGLVVQSPRYLARDLLGHSFLPGGVIAVYRAGEREGQVFFSDLGSGAAATGALQQLQNHQARWGEIGDGKPPVGSAGFEYSDPALGQGTAVATGRFVIGAHGDLTAEERWSLLAGLIRGLAETP